MSSDELLSKLDALLSKHRQVPPGQSGAFPDIPVLVDVVETPTEALPANVPTPAPVPIDELVAAAAPSALSDSDLEALGRSIYRHVMSNLEAQLAGELRDRLTDRLASIIDNTVATAIDDFRQELANAVSDAITEALLDYTESHTSVSAPSVQPESEADSL